MALKAMLESVEELAPEIAEHYTEKDGKYYLAVTPVDGLELSVTKGLKSALGKEKESVVRLKKQVETFGDLDPIAAREALDKMDEIANWTPDEKTKEQQEAFEKQLTTKLEKERQQQLAKFTGEQEKLTARNTVLQKQLHHTMIDMAATKAIIDADAEPELLLHKVTSRMEVREDGDGKFQTVILDSEGNPQMTTAPGKYDELMSIDEFIAELREIPALQPAFKGSGMTGTGGKPSASSTPGQKKHTVTAAQAADFQTYRNLKIAAEKDGVQLTPIPD